MPSLVPEWAPNLHPLVIHFPIALLFGAFVIDAIALFARRSRGLHVAAVVLYGLGTVGVVVAYLTGQEAVDTVELSSEALSAASAHENWALSTLIFFVAYTAIRIGALFVSRMKTLAVRLPLLLIAVAGLYLVWHTGEHGGNLVFEHGVGVEAVGKLSAELDELRARERALAAEGAGPVVEEDGSWSWYVSKGADLALEDAFEWMEGSPEAVEAEVIETERGPVLSLETDGQPVLFATGESLRDLQIEAVLNLDDFDGRVLLVHNVADAETYHYLSVDDNRIVQGRVVDGSEEALAEGRREASGWVTLRASGSDAHFYGYENDRTVAHGHSDQPEAGLTGLRLEGEGTLLLERIAVRAVE